MSKAKARAFEEDLSATASSLASNEEAEEARPVAYRYFGDDYAVELLTLDDFNGDEVLLPPDYDREALQNLKAITETNARNHKKFENSQGAALRTVIILGSASLIAAMILDINDAPTPAIVCVALSLFLISSVLWGRRILRRILKRLFPQREVSILTAIEDSVQAPQGFKSLSSQNRFKIGSPNHKTLYEAVKLLKQAHKVNEELNVKVNRQSELDYKRKNSELRREVSTLEEEIAELKRNLSEIETAAEKLLLRIDD